MYQHRYIINDNPAFRIELLKQADVNIDYILMLMQKYHDGNCKDKVLIADVERAFRGGGIPESGTEVVDLMTEKPSRFGGGGAYATVKQRILDKLKAFYERFAGME